MNILCIGNSFSQDATRYLSAIAKADGFELNVVNLYIGGCSLHTHFRNIMTEEKAYYLEVNGQYTGFCVSVKEALLNREWDVVTMQQVSNRSVDYESYQPYLNELSAYVKKFAPQAKQIIHQTWPYEKDSYRLCVELGYSKPEEMFSDIEKAYENAAREIAADGMILSGKLISKMGELGFTKVYRDTFHASLGAGRYGLGLLWYKTLTGRGISENAFRDFDEPVSEAEIAKIKACVDNVVNTCSVVSE